MGLRVVAILKGMGVRGLAAALGAAFPAFCLAAEGPTVVVTVKPLHSLVAGIMAGAGSPELIVRGMLSPHVYVMRPSDVEMLDRADLVVWVGATMETFLHRQIPRIEKGATVVSPLALHGVTVLARRRGTRWQPDYDEILPDGRPNPVDLKAWIDAHVWLDPHNARAIVGGLVGVLARLDPKNGQIYARNGKQLRDRLSSLDRELRKKLVPYHDSIYLVFHDAYQYFERRYRLSPAGSVTVHPENPPSARRIVEVKRLIAESDASCVFSEPQFKSGIVDRLISASGARHGVLDPIGAKLTPGPDLYFIMMRRLAQGLGDCLKQDAANFGATP